MVPLGPHDCSSLLGSDYPLHSCPPFSHCKAFTLRRLIIVAASVADAAGIDLILYPVICANLFIEASTMHMRMHVHAAMGCASRFGQDYFWLLPSREL